jgi:hypothetical protein
MAGVIGKGRGLTDRARLVSVVLLASATLALASAPANAAFTHEFLAEPSAEITKGVPASAGAPLPGPVNGVNSMTVDSGDLWLAEKREGTGDTPTDEFDAATGKFLLQFSPTPSFTPAFDGIALGHVTGKTEVYVVGADEAGKGVVGVLDSSGALQATWSGAETMNGSFTHDNGGDTVAEVVGVAVDASSSPETNGDVYVAAGSRNEAFAQFNVVDVFKPVAGGKEPATVAAPLTGTCISPGTCPGETVPFARPSGVAVSPFNSDVLVVDATKVVDVFEPTVLGEYAFVRQLTGTPAGAFGEIHGVAAGGNGNIYVANGQTVDEFSAAGESVGSLTETPVGLLSGVRSVAVDSDPSSPSFEDVYVGDFNGERQQGSVDVFGKDLTIPDVVTEPASEVTPRSATLNGKVNPHGVQVTSCEFEYGTSTSYGATGACATNPGAGSAEVAVGANVTGLQSGTTYHFRLDVRNANGTSTSDDAEFVTSGPNIHNESVSDVAATSATLNASINPDNTATSYFFQYGTEDCATVGQRCEEAPAAPGTSIGSGENAVVVSEHVQHGLQAGTLYHYRVVAVSKIEVSPGAFETQEFDGPDQTFTTQTAGGFVLPDGRAWEMVSPPNKHGALIEPIGETGVVQASASGDAISYAATAPTEAGAQGSSNNVQVLSTRGRAGWRSQDIAIPHATATALSLAGQEYRYFSSDLSRAIVQPFGSFTPCRTAQGAEQPCVSTEASEQTPFLRTDFTSGDATELCASSCYHPLVTATNVPAGVKFGGEAICLKQICGPEFLAATPDGSDVVLRSDVALTATPGDAGGLYEWADGSLQLVSVLPGGAPSGAADALLGNDPQIAHAISSDGSRVVWRDQATHHLYMRDTEHRKTVQLDTPQPGSGEGTAGPVFQTASATGSKVLFTDSQRLTEGSGASEGRPDLYECEVVEEAGEQTCELSDMTPPAPGGERATVRGTVLGAGEDANSVYFVAGGILANNVASNKEQATLGGDNLYLRRDGTTTFIAALSSEDAPDWSSQGELARQTARVSPNGRWLAFMSQRSLTEYDNEDVTSKVAGEKVDEELYLYDGASGSLVCASCDPSGARPVGVEAGARLVSSRIWNPSTWLAATIPGWTPYQGLNRSLYQSRYLSDSGRLYFDSNDALVPQDVNGNWDVYEYEPPGVPNGSQACTESTGTFSARSDGCVNLISSGSSAEESAFVDASKSGGDVFFLTAAKLSTQDFDTSLDVYDAHECASSSPCIAAPASQPPPCNTGDSCKPAPSPQPGIFGAPSSATFSGLGNVAATTPKPQAKPLTRAQKLAKALTACRRKPKRRRPACVKQAHKKYGPVRKARKSADRNRRPR